MLRAKSKVGFELGGGHLQLQVVSPVHQLAVVVWKERLFRWPWLLLLLTCFLQMPILFTSLVEGLVRTPTPLILSLGPYEVAVPNSLIHLSSTLFGSSFVNLVLPNFLCTFSRMCTFIPDGEWPGNWKCWQTSLSRLAPLRCPLMHCWIGQPASPTYNNY